MSAGIVAFFFCVPFNRFPCSLRGSKKKQPMYDIQRNYTAALTAKRKQAHEVMLMSMQYALALPHLP